MTSLCARSPIAWLAALLLSSSPGIQAATLRVPEQFATVQNAIDAAVDGDVVLVSAGKYGGFSLVDKNIEVASVSGPEATELFGNSIDSTLRIYRTTSHVHGFTVTYGNADEGGGIDVLEGAPEIDDMIVTGNHGGGIGVFESAARVHHDRVFDNWDNGGIEISNSIGAAVYDNDIEDNTGPGIFVFGGAPAILRNVIRGNDGQSYGGGIFADTFSGPGRLKVADNLIVGNTAWEGGGITVFAEPGSNSVWVNNTVADNTSRDLGSQMSIGAAVHPANDRRHMVFANNVFSGTDVAVHCWNTDGASPVFDHDDVYPAADGVCAETAVRGTNFSLPPDFTAGANGHPYHLAPDSPLIDAGSNQAAHKLHTDLGKRPRVIDGGHGPIVDIGAYEYRPD